VIRSHQDGDFILEAANHST